jgi:hypothetical protein
MSAATSLPEALRAEVTALHAATLDPAELLERLNTIARRHAAELAQIGGEFAETEALTFGTDEEGTLEGDLVPFFRRLSANLTDTTAATSVRADVRELAVRATRAPDGHFYSLAPKVVVPGVFGHATGAECVQVDSDRYANHPCVIPNSCAVLPQEWQRLQHRPYHQASLPFDLRGHRPLSSELADLGGSVISVEAAKLGILYSTTLATVQRWTERIRTLAGCTRDPGHALRERDFSSAVRAHDELDRLHVFTPARMRMRIFRFDALPVLAPRVDPEKKVIYAGLNGTLTELQRGFGREYRGAFPINLTGVLALQRALDLRFYVRLASAIGAAHEYVDAADVKRGVRFNVEAFKDFARTPDEWARILNAYSQGSLDYLAAARDDWQKRRRSPSQDRRRVEEAAEHLVALKLGAAVHIENPNADRRIIVLPTAAALEAQQLLKKRTRSVPLVELRYREPTPSSTPPTPTPSPAVSRPKRLGPRHRGGVLAQANAAADLVAYAKETDWLGNLPKDREPHG